MSGNEFVDTNILIYAFDLTAGEKRQKAAALVERLWSERTGCVNLQVLQEFHVTATRKLRMPSSDALAQVERLGHWTISSTGLERRASGDSVHRAKKSRSGTR